MDNRELFGQKMGIFHINWQHYAKVLEKRSLCVFLRQYGITYPPIAPGVSHTCFPDGTISHHNINHIKLYNT